MSKPLRGPRKRVRRGLWSPEEDSKLTNYIAKYGHGCWSYLPKLADTTSLFHSCTYDRIDRCGKSCRLRWLNYLRPDLKRGALSSDEEDAIIQLHSTIGNRWSQIAARLPGRTDNEVKNFWHSFIKKKLRRRGIDPVTHKPLIAEQLILPSVDRHMAHVHPAVTAQSCMCIGSSTDSGASSRRRAVFSEDEALAQHILPSAIPPAVTAGSSSNAAVVLGAGACSDAALASPVFIGYLDAIAFGVVHRSVIPEVSMAGSNPSGTGACTAAFTGEQWSNRTNSSSQFGLTQSGTVSATNQLRWPIGGGIEAVGAALDDLEWLHAFTGAYLLDV